MDTLVKQAYDNWMQVVEYDGKSLLSLDQNKTSDAPQYDLACGSQNHSNSCDHQLNLPSVPASTSSEQPPTNPGLNMGLGGIYICIRCKILVRCLRNVILKCIILCSLFCFYC